MQHHAQTTGQADAKKRLAAELADRQRYQTQRLTPRNTGA